MLVVEISRLFLITELIMDRVLHVRIFTVGLHRFWYLYIRPISAYVTGSGKTGLIRTSTEIQFLSISERYTHALPRNTKYLAIDGQVCFYRRLFADAVKHTKVHVMVLGRINRTAWGTKLLLTTVWASLWIVPVHVTY